MQNVTGLTFTGVPGGKAVRKICGTEKITKEGMSLLGMADGWTALVWLLNVAAMLLCVVYGIINWNKGGEDW